jgi:hypothetical protein
MSIPSELEKILLKEPKNPEGFSSIFSCFQFRLMVISLETMFQELSLAKLIRFVSPDFSSTTLFKFMLIKTCYFLNNCIFFAN